jgi:uroporphyrinogen decarboxylase
MDCLHPLEVKAGMDIRPLKKEYGDRLAFIGNIDARLFQANDLDGLRREIMEKVPVAMAGGGYIFHSDHSLPPGTRLETYRFALELVNECGIYR